MKLLAVVAALSVSASLLTAQVSRDGMAISPFRGMRAVEGGLEVQVDDDTWWALGSVAGVDTGTLLAEADRLCGRSAWKRLTEDLPALLAAMGHTVGDTVDLEVRDLATGVTKSLPAVAMTRENRQRLWTANKNAPRVELDTKVPGTLARADVRADFEALRRLLDTQFAYRELRRVDLDALLREAEAGLGEEPIARERFVAAVDHVLRAFGDGHSRLQESAPPGDAFLPVLVQQVDGGHVVFRADRSRLLDAERPFLVAIDGVPLAKWLDAARARGTAGSPVMQARDAERGLRDLATLRASLGLPANDLVELTLRGPAGERAIALEPGKQRPVYGAWPRTATRRLDGDVGYLRLLEMAGDAAFLDGLDAAMQSFRDTKGLVIDVRGNGGGTRDALRRLAPYFLPADGFAVVGNVAAALLDPTRPPRDVELADRGLYPADWPSWSDAARTAIARCLKNWKPSWPLPTGRFSPWHFLVLDRADNPNAFAYDKPVVLLIDRGCFSATDVFAAAFAELPRVTLVGEATSGGSGRARGHQLPKSRIRLQLSSMASFRPDGVLFEGNGVAPDVEVVAQPGDLIGATDTALAKALEVLRPR